jgi:exodeoxyribonuclease V gamma subunit
VVAGATQPRTLPGGWAERARTAGAVFEATDDVERAVLAALDTALADWLDACAQAGFERAGAAGRGCARPGCRAWTSPPPAAASRPAASPSARCCRCAAIPFEVVCLLGMNDGDYPRRGLRSDFDLMALPGQAGPATARGATTTAS